MAKYYNRDPSQFFQPVAVETSKTFGPETLAFLQKLGCRAKSATEEKRSFPFLTQWIAVAIQRGNCACMMGSLDSDSNPDDLVFIKWNYIWLSCIIVPKDRWKNTLGRGFPATSVFDVSLSTLASHCHSCLWYPLCCDNVVKLLEIETEKGPSTSAWKKLKFVTCF